MRGRRRGSGGPGVDDGAEGGPGVERRQGGGDGDGAGEEGGDRGAWRETRGLLWFLLRFHRWKVQTELAGGAALAAEFWCVFCVFSNLFSLLLLTRTQLQSEGAVLPLGIYPEVHGTRSTASFAAAARCRRVDFGARTHDSLLSVSSLGPNGAAGATTDLYSFPSTLFNGGRLDCDASTINSIAFSHDEARSPSNGSLALGALFSPRPPSLAPASTRRRWTNYSGHPLLTRATTQAAQLLEVPRQAATPPSRDPRTQRSATHPPSDPSPLPKTLSQPRASLALRALPPPHPRKRTSPVHATASYPTPSSHPSSSTTPLQQHTTPTSPSLPLSQLFEPPRVPLQRSKTASVAPRRTRTAFIARSRVGGRTLWRRCVRMRWGRVIIGVWRGMK